MNDRDAAGQAPRSVLAALLAATTLPVMANFCIAPVLAKMQAHFAAVAYAAVLTPMVMTLPALVGTVAAPLSGVVADRVPKRTLLLVATIAFGAIGILPYFMASLHAILATRLLLGIAEGTVITCCTALIAEYCQGRLRQQLYGLQHATMSVAGILFLLAGGIVGEASWQNPFLLFALGFVVAGVVWTLPRRAAAAPAGRVHVAFPWKLAAPVLAAAFFGWLFYYLIPAGVPFLLRERGLFSTRLAGSASAAALMASMAGSIGYITLVRFLSARLLLAAAYAAMAAGFAVIAASNGIPALVAGCIVTGLGFGLVMPNVSVMLLGRVPPETRGRAAGGITMSVLTSVFCTPLLRLGAARALGGTPAVFGAGALILAVAAIALAIAGQRKVA
ncbi:MAG: MFS transporter [Gammaproteobacteria bacterium]|nr:MFS transporter [Gammaproteobacteria bacterium]